MAYEFGKALPAQITPERLWVARSRVAAVCEIEPSTIKDSFMLAQTLQGVSRAVSDIVFAISAVETTDLRVVPGSDPATMLENDADNILRRFADPASRIGRMFVAQAQPSKGNGASMGVHEVTASSQKATHNVVIPTDQIIDRLLMQEPCLWDEEGVLSRDLRSRQSNRAYPFCSREYHEGDARRYFTVLQELSAELVDA